MEAFENYLFFGVIGFVAGIIVTRFYFKTSIQKRDISRVIEYAMIEKNISMLESLTRELNLLVSRIHEEGEELGSQLQLTKDVETMFRTKPSPIEEVQDSVLDEALQDLEAKGNNKEKEVTDYDEEPIN
ncbi:MAG: hypothetical protein ACETVY_04455 [Candidatus Bathyarchaeia archaeon]